MIDSVKFEDVIEPTDQHVLVHLPNGELSIAEKV